ncbi:MAG: Methionine-tRNA ligase [Candidatus Amesbacteria bacterium GW2011_GWA1_47_16]|uniref:Methionine--tRNA ligase n=3 Tax=Candidatus Amesiibacteriota TaxID=1752730 RepID=A0A0G1UFZ9_9BACT|nr:MAG: Methionine-tRNA ligase [Candidatus Amesbacteria bacterium GW2011_GWA1_47_16]KKU65038.1 MAG: Methionine-tRNA ligase [Candidatus Amesbacteria bacterium GW2011_GWC1_47_15]KKU96493.1 MAG: Methionine-tRNA ligase [Candidatus Amesbacteria bacterium GW2011_GWB1_48_13]
MKPTIQFNDFEKLDLRVGRVTAVTVPGWSEKLVEMKVDLGEETGVRTILAGIKQWYGADELVGKKFIFIANLAERKIKDAVSQGMMLAAVEEDERAVLIEIPEQVPVGTMLR